MSLPRHKNRVERGSGGKAETRLPLVKQGEAVAVEVYPGEEDQSNNRPRCSGKHPATRQQHASMDERGSSESTKHGGQMLQTRVVWRQKTTTPQNGRTRGQHGCSRTKTGHSFHRDKNRDERVREVGPHTPCAPRKARQKSGPRTMDGTPEVCNRDKRRNNHHWRKLVQEAGENWQNFENLTADKGKWKSLIRKRRAEMTKWEKQMSEWKRGDPRLSRNSAPTMKNPLHCRWQGCSFVGSKVAAETNIRGRPIRL